MPGQSSVKQTQSYAIAQQAIIGSEMSILNGKLIKKKIKMSPLEKEILNKLEKEIQKNKGER